MLTTVYYYVTVISLLIFILLIGVALILKLITKPYPVVLRHEEETSFLDVTSKERKKFPLLHENASVNLSVVVPAYNEEDRLCSMMDEAIQYLEGRLSAKFTYEIIIVSDGSRDHTVDVAYSYTKKWGSNKVRCLELIRNRGKGGAVRLGVQSSRGACILFADADGATKFEDLSKLEDALKDITSLTLSSGIQELSLANAIVIGSRAHLEKESLATRSIFRNILMYGFHFLVWLFAVRGIRDTQCGFKLFTRTSAQTCFESLHVDRWAFDVELLCIAQKLKIPISEVGVRWMEIEGSKVTPVITWVQMGVDLCLIWLKYSIGAWRIKSEKLN